GLADALRPAVPGMAAAMLGLAAYRIGPDRGLLAPRALGRTAAAMLAGQLALPMALAGLAAATGWGGPVMAALILMAAAPCIAGAPSLTALAGGDPAPALRLLAVGVAALPLTVLPVFHLAPFLGDPSLVAAAALRLGLTILLACGAGLALRALTPQARLGAALGAADGLTVLAFLIMVVGLMAGAGPALASGQAGAMAALGAAFGANFGLQLLAWAMLRRAGAERPALTVAAGNRNIALFLIALPAAVTDPLAHFIAFYQIPMFLTPMLVARLMRRP
ncbi:MAG: hypothetical protein ACK4WC_15745, partial [Rubrimonas sp.]